MIDRQYLNSILNPVKTDAEEHLIHAEDIIPYDVVCSMYEKPKTLVMACFAKAPDPTHPPKFTFEYKCDTCGAPMVVTTSKSDFVNCISGKRKKTSGYHQIICDKCQVRKEEISKRREKMKLAIEREQEYRRLLNSISQYIVIQNDKNSNSPAKNYYEMTHSLPYDEKTFADKIQELSYPFFLNTVYWKRIAAYKRYKSGYVCELCGKNGQLNVHHKTYIHHGYEHRNLNDLIVLCQDCHTKFHDKIIEPKE